MSELKRDRIIGYGIFIPSPDRKFFQEVKRFSSKEEAIEEVNQMLKDGLIYDSLEGMVFIPAAHLNYIRISPIIS